MEPIEGVNNIPASRWKLTCYICKLRVGACIQCSNKSCYTSFHVSCARQAKLFLQLSPGGVYSANKSFCDRHLPDWYREEFDVDRIFGEAQRYFASHTDAGSLLSIGTDIPTRGKFVVSLKRPKKSAVVPAIVFADIQLYMQKFRIRNKAEFIADMCKYWSLKRRSKRGASLLKRLQLQVDDSAAQKLDDHHKTQKLEFGKGLLNELDNCQRPLLEDILEREITKKERCAMRDDIIERIYLPLQPFIRRTVEVLRHLDTHNLLATTSVSIENSEISVCKITWPLLLQYVAEAKYASAASLQHDLEQLLSNILAVFPEVFHKEHKFALKLQEKLPIILADCHTAEKVLALDENNLTAKCFDNQFEPDGLLITEEKPFNWANRDASPLSDMDDYLVDQLACDMFGGESLADASPNQKTEISRPALSALSVQNKTKLRNAPTLSMDSTSIRSTREKASHGQDEPFQVEMTSSAPTPQKKRRSTLGDLQRSTPRMRRTPVANPATDVVREKRFPRTIATRISPEASLPVTPVQTGRQSRSTARESAVRKHSGDALESQRKKHRQQR